MKILDRHHNDDAIIREVRENWHPWKREIDESRWRKALRWMKDEGIVPTVGNRHLASKTGIDHSHAE